MVKRKKYRKVVEYDSAYPNWAGWFLLVFLELCLVSVVILGFGSQVELQSSDLGTTMMFCIINTIIWSLLSLLGIAFLLENMPKRKVYWEEM